MDDDFNTPEAIAILFELAGDINRIRKTQSDASAAATRCIFADDGRYFRFKAG